jgi:hypothetical protein
MSSGATPGRRLTRAFGLSKVHRAGPVPVLGIRAQHAHMDIPDSDRYQRKL